MSARRLDSNRDRARIAAGGSARVVPEILECTVHGSTEFVRRSDGAMRCKRCRSLAVTTRRRKVKEILIAEAGGGCLLCGYSRCVRALQFHHLDPDGKKFGFSAKGLAKSIAVMRAEASKCVLLCANCHAEVESGVTQLSLK